MFTGCSIATFDPQGMPLNSHGLLSVLSYLLMLYDPGMVRVWLPTGPRPPAAPRGLKSAQVSSQILASVPSQEVFRDLYLDCFSRRRRMADWRLIFGYTPSRDDLG